MKKLLPITILAVALSQASATVVSFTGSPASPRFLSSSLVPIGDGNLIEVGTMTAGDPSTFQVFGTTTTATLAGQNSRIFGGAVNNLGGEDPGDALFNNREVYIWVYSTPAKSPTADQAIFRATANATAWIFPVDGGALDTVTLSIVGINQAINPPGFDGAAVLPANPANNWGNFPGLKLGAIPEPSVGILSMLTTGLLLVRRRR